MNLNATLLIQMLVFATFVWITMKFIWPPLTKALEARRKNIADGLAAAERGHKDLELAQHKVKSMLTEAKTEAAAILEQANQRASRIVEESKEKARVEAARLIQMAQQEMDQQYQVAKETLIQQVSAMAVAGAQKIIQREIDQPSNESLINELTGGL